MITVEDLRRAHFRAVVYGDGARGSWFQIWRCVEHPRLTVTKQAEHRGAPATRTLFVDDTEVADLEAAARSLNEMNEGGEPCSSSPA